MSYSPAGICKVWCGRLGRLHARRLASGGQRRAPNACGDARTHVHAVHTRRCAQAVAVALPGFCDSCQDHRDEHRGVPAQHHVQRQAHEQGSHQAKDDVPARGTDRRKSV